ncbi:MAG: hypothetical protein PHW46_06790 [Candidatus Omnitrophica bacterium]|nr:hypothetical protein [Candidatus Omnitrophota bacterium]
MIRKISFLWLAVLLTFSSALFSSQISAQEAIYIKIVFYCNNKGECLGYAELDKGSLNVSVKDPKIEAILRSGHYIPLSDKEIEEIVMPDGRRIIKNGMLLYESGTVDHLKAVIPKLQKMGYIVEVEQGKEYLA